MFESLFSVIGDLAPIVQIIVILFVSMIFWEPIAQKLGWKKETDESTPLWAQKLIQYANHDTTKMHEKTHEKLETLDDSVKEVVTTLKEIKEYGIKCRKDV